MITEPNLETGIGGGENFDFSGVPKFDPFLYSFYRKSPIGGQKSKLCNDNFRGEFPPPSSVWYVLTPPIPVSNELLYSHLFLCILFSFFCPVRPTLPHAIFSPKIPSSGTSHLLFLVEKREPAGAGFWGGSGRFRRTGKKGKSFFFGARKR